MNPEYLASVGLRPVDLAGLVAMGCTLDRNDAAIRGWTAETIREPFASSDEVETFGTAESWISANPAHFVGPHAPPTLVVVARAERFFPAILRSGRAGRSDADRPSRFHHRPGGRHRGRILTSCPRRGTIYCFFATRSPYR